MVYAMPDGTVTFFQDRRRQYPFFAGRAALPLLRGLLEVNQRIFAISRSRIDATDDPQVSCAWTQRVGRARSLFILPFACPSGV